MKLISVAVLALISQSGAVRLQDDIEDLWSDNGEADETMQSLAAAEKAHGAKFEGLSQTEQSELIKSKNMMNFKDDEFVKNTQRTFTEKDKALIMTENTVEYPMPQPIGLLMTKSKDLASGGMELGLSGTMDDAEEYEETMESLKSAEFTMGKKMKAPAVNSQFYERSGSKIENLLAGDQHRITEAQIEEGLKSQDEEIAKRAEKKQVEVKKVAVEAKKEEQKSKIAFNQMAAHFHDDDVYDESWD